MANLENIGIPRERIYIPNPDFVTENFKPIELIEALKIFIEENYEEEESCRFQNQFYSTILAKLDASNKEKPYEDIVIENFPDPLKKTEFADFLSRIMIDKIQKKKKRQISI